MNDNHEPYPTMRELRAKIRKFDVTPVPGSFGLDVGDDGIWTTLIDRRCCGLGIALLGRPTTHNIIVEEAELDCADLWGEDWTMGYIEGFDGLNMDFWATPEWRHGYRLGKRHALALIKPA